MLKDAVIAYAVKTYGAEPAHPFRTYPDYISLNHSDTGKWFGLIMEIPADKLGIERGDYVDIINVKADSFMIGSLRMEEGIYPAWHMNKDKWISVLLDGTVPLEQVTGLLDFSFALTASKEKKKEIRGPKDWLVPCNPKYHDIVHDFDHTDVIDWKQGANIRVGDTVYLYVTAPYSCIFYKTEVIAADIIVPPDSSIYSHCKKLMTVRLLHRFEPGQYTFDRLRDEYDIGAIRSPRGITSSLKLELDMY